MIAKSDGKRGLRFAFISLHGLIRMREPELGRDADTGGQVKYVLELAAELGRRPEVEQVDVITRQIIDERVGPDYAQVEEPIGENSRIVRIPFGPKRYLKKEALWPYVDLFVDQAVTYFRRNGLPDVIHGHYADAGYAGAQLARLLHVPYVFTGHSLGRVKRERLTHGDADPQSLEKKYRFRQRIEAEELSLETASLVVASTHQEIEDQYQRYDHYAPERMEVIPPGVDLDLFRPAEPNEDFTEIRAALAPFLREPEKPIIMAMARPDERKNLGMLFRVYGESPDLQRLANLVVVMGTREDLRKFPRAQREALLEALTLIDVYDLYGKVAYPKGVNPTMGGSLFRLAAESRGMFVNPALTEPFGLTLLEAAGSGLPIVATHDGGPRDIVANCRNGVLIDPHDAGAIERAILRGLTEPDQWQEWADSGLAGARKHYSWAAHVDRYLREITETFERWQTPVLAEGGRPARRPEFERLLIADLDNTLAGDDPALHDLSEMINSSSDVGFGIVTGRRLDDARRIMKDLDLPTPDVLLTSAGTELYYGTKLTRDESWQKQMGFQWKPDEIYAALDEIQGLYRQPEAEQSKFKISYTADPEIAPKLARLRKILREKGLRVKLVLSLGIYLDAIPQRAGTGLALRHLLYKWGFSPEHVLVAGDSGNDEEMLKGRTLGVVVGNHGPELNRLKKMPRIYFAEGKHARGILEGIEYYGFMNAIRIPNDLA
ncbi:MAG TPA: HAD-IIB family hydrolase [Pirellulaceae bacterium]|jgi:sucrose-phosphate synthase|nr:HAD-IIB family hydrolase [Pirellulaceae bacterium]